MNIKKCPNSLKSILLFGIVLISHGIVYTQNTSLDSLKNLLLVEPISLKKIDHYNAVSSDLIDLGKYDEALNELANHTVSPKLSVNPANRNVPHKLEDPGNYQPSIAGNQRIAQRIDKLSFENTSHFLNIIDLPHGTIPYSYLIKNFTNQDSIYLVTTGILTDGEIQALTETQERDDVLKVLSKSKDVQLTQIQ